MPDRYDGTTGSYFSATVDGAPSALVDLASNGTASGYGPVYELIRNNTATNIHIASRGVVPATAGRVYKIEVEYERTAFTGSGSPTLNVWVRGQNSSYASTGQVGNSTIALTSTGVLTSSFKVASAASSGILAWSAGSAWLRPMVRLTGVSGADVTVQIRRMTITDVTESESASTSATAAATSFSNASTQATNAGTSATSATTSANTATTKATDAGNSATAAAGSASAAAGSASAAATSFSNASTQATNAGTSASAAAGSALTATNKATDSGNSATAAAGSASAAAGSATAANGSAVAANGSAITAASYAILSASIGQGYLNKNPGFDDYANATVGTLPTGWSTDATGTGAGYRVSDQLGGYGWRVPAAAATAVSAGMSHATDNQVQLNGYYVVEADVILNTGALTGAGVLFRTTTSAGVTVQDLSMVFSSTPDQTGAAPGIGSTGKNYQFRKLVKATTGAPVGFVLHAMNHYATFGSIAAANDITWLKCAVRPATQAEIRDSTVLAPMEATVTTQGTAIATHETKLASYVNRVSAGSGTAELSLVALDSGGVAATTITLKADKIKLGGISTPALEISSGVATFNGELNVGGTTGARTNIQKDVIKVYDASSVMRVKIGNLAL